MKLIIAVLVLSCLYLASNALNITDRNAALTQVCTRLQVPVNATTAYPTFRSVVAAAVTNVTTTYLVGFFNGSAPALGYCKGRNCPNNLASQTSADALIDGLSAYFGRVIGCDKIIPTWPASPFPIYDVASMAGVHSFMNIDQRAYNLFVNIVAYHFGPALLPADLALVGGYLQNFGIAQANYTDGRGSICTVFNGTNPCPSMCDFYVRGARGDGVAPKAGLKDIVLAAVQKVVAAGNINQKYFTKVNGVANSPINPSKTDYLDAANGARLQALLDKLTNFFGQSGVLGCSDVSGSYDIGAPIHQQMMITDAEFTQFNTDVASVVTPIFSAQDLATVGGVLASTRTAVVYQGSATPTGGSRAPNTPTAPNSGSTLAASFTALFCLILAYFF